MPVPGIPPRVAYSGRARDVLVQIVRASCPSDLEDLGITEDVVRYIQDSLAYAPLVFARALGLGLIAVDAASVLDGGGTPLSRMPLERARTYVEGSGHGINVPRIAVVRQVRMLALMGYFEHDVVKKRLGYDPDSWIAKSIQERQERHADDL
jgi:hypothetical protein